MNLIFVGCEKEIREFEKKLKFFLYWFFNIINYLIMFINGFGGIGKIIFFKKLKDIVENS